jgi:hypothetical protein
MNWVEHGLATNMFKLPEAVGKGETLFY